MILWLPDPLGSRDPSSSRILCPSGIPSGSQAPLDPGIPLAPGSTALAGSLSRDPHVAFDLICDLRSPGSFVGCCCVTLVTINRRQPLKYNIDYISIR